MYTFASVSLCFGYLLLFDLQIVNTWSEAELGRIIRDYGEDKMWRQIARRIVTARASQPLTTTSQLVAAIGDTVMGGKGKGKKGGSGPKTIHPATRTFQVGTVTLEF